MKQITSKIVDIDTTIEKFEREVIDLENIYNEVNKLIIPQGEMRKVKVEKLNPQEVIFSTNLGKVSIVRKSYNQKNHEVQYNIDAPGFSKLILWIQSIPKEKNCTKVRLVLGYKTSLSPIGLMIRPLMKEEEVKDGLDHLVNMLKDHYIVKMLKDHCPDE